MNTNRSTGIALSLAVVLSTASATLARQPQEQGAVATTRHFAFHSDFATNLNDALMEAGRTRNNNRPELFHSGAKESCFAELPPSARTAWNLAVDYYAEIISPATFGKRQQYLIRVDLAGVEELQAPKDLRFIGIARSFIGAATAAYKACRWATQDTENRRWIQKLQALLQVHEKAVSLKLAHYYKKPFAGLPIRVDVVETVSWSGANTIILDPDGGHILISKEEPGPASLELVFHEASHTLMGRKHPVQLALAQAAKQLDKTLPRDLWHAVLFYTTGDTLRRVLAEAGEPPYTPMMHAGNIFGRFHKPLELAWPAYLDGKRTLSEAALDLILALDEAETDLP